MIWTLLIACGVWIDDDEHLRQIDDDEDGVSVVDDCNDRNDALSSVETWFLDADRDGIGAGEGSLSCGPPGADWVLTTGDCNDDDPDWQTVSTWHEDRDGDGHGSVVSVEACGPPEGFVVSATDCDDTDATVNPDRYEQCNDVDDDCNGFVDDDVENFDWFDDGDGDGFGDPGTVVSTCVDLPTGTGVGGDCDDANPGVNPGAQEVCDGVDNDCDALVDLDDPDNDGDAVWYRDEDDDGYGAGVGTAGCEEPEDGPWSISDGDCDDTTAVISPGAPEICDGQDNDCDMLVDMADPEISDAETFWEDGDGDGFGNPAISVQDCALPSGHVANGDDCYDQSADVFPRERELRDTDADTVCTDSLDNDCDGDLDLQDEECMDDDGDGVLNGKDPIRPYDLDGDGNLERLCVVARYTMPEDWRGFDTVLVVRDFPLPDSLDSTGDRVPLGTALADAWCVDLTGWNEDTYRFELVSERSEADPATAVDEDDCSDWLRADIGTYCDSLPGVGSSDPNCTDTQVATDACQSLAPEYALHADWDGVSL